MLNDESLIEEFDQNYVKIKPELETDGNIFGDDETCDYFAYMENQKVEDKDVIPPQYDYSGVVSDPMTIKSDL